MVACDTTSRPKAKAKSRMECGGEGSFPTKLITDRIGHISN